MKKHKRFKWWEMSTTTTNYVETSSNFSKPTPPINQTKSIKELFYNGTGYYIDDEVETGKILFHNVFWWLVVNINTNAWFSPRNRLLIKVINKLFHQICSNPK